MITLHAAGDADAGTAGVARDGHQRRVALYSMVMGNCSREWISRLEQQQIIVTADISLSIVSLVNN